jgi:SulP family sulfate permease
MAITFIAVLILPIQTAVFVGVGIQILLHTFRSAERVEIVRIVPREDGQFEEHPAPMELMSGEPTILMPRGSLFFAGAAEFEEDLPSAEDSQQAVVILRLRGRDEVGSTFLAVIDRFEQTLRRNGGKLVLVGVTDRVRDQLKRTDMLAELGAEDVYMATKVYGESVAEAWEDAQLWLANQAQEIEQEEGLVS